MSYQPTPLDILWMKQHVKLIRVGGIWSYTDGLLVFQKRAHNEMALIASMDWNPRVPEQIERNKAVMAAAGIKFVDARQK